MVLLYYDTNDNLSTNRVQFVLVFVLFLSKFVTTKQQNLSFVKFCTKQDKTKTICRQFVICLTFVLFLSKTWQITNIFVVFVVTNFGQKLDKTKTNCRLSRSLARPLKQLVHFRLVCKVLESDDMEKTDLKVHFLSFRHGLVAI